MEATESLEYVLKKDKVKMNELEEEVHLLKEFHDDEEVEAQVSILIPYLGSFRIHNSNFFRNLEFYWHTKTMVAMGKLPKEKDFRQLKNRKEALEIMCLRSSLG